MSTTDKLCCLLRERGVEYEAPHAGFTIVRTDNAVCKFYETLEEPERGVFAVVTTDWLTPEQAIAATLGRWMLTADDVRDLIERHSDASGGNGRDFHNGAYVAIADELNNTLGSCNCSNSERTGTCHNASKVMDEHGQARFACSECGAWIDSRMLWNPEYRNGESPWVSGCKLNFCPNCGRKVVDE